MVDYSKCVKEFSDLFNCISIKYFKNFDELDNETKILRLDLIKEEFDELKKAKDENDRVEIADAIGDSLYVAYGMGCCYGVKCMEQPKNIIPKYNDFDLIMLHLSITLKYLELGHSESRFKIPVLLNEYINWCFELSHVLKIDIGRVFTEIHSSNMSKLCISESEAELTIDFYLKNKNEECYFTPMLDKYVVYRKSDNKVCKSINYKKADLSFVLETV